MPPNLLLISLPMRHPFTVDTTAQAVAAALGEARTAVARFDAGNDFYRRLVLDPAALRDAWGLFMRRWRRGVYDRAPPEVRSVAEALRASEGQWRFRFDQAARQAGLLDAAQAPALADAVQVLESIDALLGFLSTVFFPLRLERDSLVHAGLARISDIVGFCRQEDGNPFARYARAAALPFPVTTAFCLVQGMDQVAVAATLIRAWRQMRPETRWAAVGAPPEADAVHQAAGIAMDALPRSHRALWQEAQRIRAEGTLAAPPALVSASRLEPAALADAKDREEAAVMIWHDPRGELKPIVAGLYQVARSGKWNHLVMPPGDPSPLTAGLMDFAAANPGIIHSCCRRTPGASPYSGPRQHYSLGSAPYGQTAPLPGFPIWQVLRHPQLIAAFVRRRGVESLARLRHDPANGIIFELGRSLVYTYRKPADLPEGYLDEICRMVEAGGSVAIRWVRHNLQRAFLIVYVEEYGVIVGNSSLKHPREEYVEAVSAQSGIDLRHYLERGYTSVRPEYRGFGIGAEMLAGLTRRAGDYKIFSVIGEDNIPTQKMAMRNRTRKVATFYSERAEKQIGVWIPEWMLPEGIDLPPQPQLD